MIQIAVRPYIPPINFYIRDKYLGLVQFAHYPGSHPEPDGAYDAHEPSDRQSALSAENSVAAEPAAIAIPRSLAGSTGQAPAITPADYSAMSDRTSPSSLAPTPDSSFSSSLNRLIENLNPISTAHAQERGSEDEERGLLDGSVNPMREVRLNRFYVALRELRKIEPTNPQLSITGPDYDSTEETVENLERELQEAKRRTPGRKSNRNRTPLRIDPNRVFQRGDGLQGRIRTQTADRKRPGGAGYHCGWDDARQRHGKYLA